MILRSIFKPIDLGVRFELTLKIFIVALFSSLLMGSAVYKIFENAMVQKEKRQFDGVASFLSHHFHPDKISPVDMATLFDLRSIWFLDKRYKPVSGFGEMPSLNRPIKPGTRIAKSGIIVTRYKDISSFLPIKKGRENASYLFVKKGLNTLNDELNQIQKIILFIVLLTTFLIIVLLNILLKATMTSPIHNIINDIEEIKNGKKNLLEGRYLREFDFLIKNFNNLLQLTNTQKKELNDKLLEVQRLNRLLSKYHKEMIRFEKLVSIGELSSGIAHEIGNPLNNILGFLSLLKEELKTLNNPSVKDYLSRILQETNRIHQIIRGMLDFSRKEGDLKIRSVNLKLLLEETIQLANLMVKKKEIEFKRLYPEKEIHVLVDPKRFQQVVLNLLSNAIDSIETDGTIHVEIDYVNDLGTFEKELLFQGKDLPGKYIRLTIRDNGVGINQRDLNRIFDPFFTTKEPGKGTGLGLFVSQQLVKEMRGILRLDSHEGQGTVATVILPKGSES